MGGRLSTEQVKRNVNGMMKVLLEEKIRAAPHKGVHSDTMFTYEDFLEVHRYGVVGPVGVRCAR